MSETAAQDLIARFRQAGIELWEDAGRLRYRAPKGALTDERRALLRDNRDAVLAVLRGDPEQVIVPAPEQAAEPFPLTDVQSAYLLGRNEAFGLGGVSCHVYVELDLPGPDPVALESAWNRLIARHDMLRAVIDPGGSQRVLPEVPRYRIAVHDLRGLEPGAAAERREELRARLGHKAHPVGEWPMFDIEVSTADDGGLLHFSMDFLISDWAGIRLLLDELRTWYATPEATLPPISLTFRDHLLGERRLRETPRYQRDKEYWWSLLDTLPGAPELPTVEPRDADAEEPRFDRHQLHLPAARWDRLRERARARGVTPSVAVLTAYADVIGAWSAKPDFLLNLTMLNRSPLHPDVDRVVGDFTSVSLLGVTGGGGRSFTGRARDVGARLFDDLDHRLYSGIEVMRELSRRRGREAALTPIVFTSAIGLSTDAGPAAGPRSIGDFGHGITQTPQVRIDCQAMDGRDGLRVNWDVRRGVFPARLIEDMFAAFDRLLGDLADADHAWDDERGIPLPDWQRAERDAANDTIGPEADGLLHEGFLRQAARTPDRPAVIGPAGSRSYAELLARATGVARWLLRSGCVPGEQVAIVMDKGAEQVDAAIGVLLAGCAYLPVDTVQPRPRRDAILTGAGVRLVLTQSRVRDGEVWPDGLELCDVDLLPDDRGAEWHAPPRDPDDLAYVIYTSGSTGVPKGVMMSHRAALNTIADVNRRFEVTARDRVLGVANLGFDLSVWDIFGTLAAGGALVLPGRDHRADPSHWAELACAHLVTIWNSVPGQMQMLVDYLRTTPDAPRARLRLAMLSGDWIPVRLPGEARAVFPGARLVSLGGATEAGIWSIAHEIDRVDPSWRSIPYGRPLTNQTFHVLDGDLADRPVWCPGELHIGGAGLALGYSGDAELTAAKFVTRPATGERLYRTGDLGRYLPGGEIEFLGRQDTQVKVRGHRVELGEIEAAIAACPGVGLAAVILDGAEANSGPGERRLLGFAETARDGSAAHVDEAATARMARIAAQVAERELAGLDPARVAGFAERLERAALLSMSYALCPPGAERWRTREEIVARSGVAPAHEPLIRRWLRALLNHGLLETEPASLRLRPRDPVGPGDVEAAWREASAAWTDGLGPPELADYFAANAARLPELMKGDVTAVSLLFDEARPGVPSALYRDNVMARHLNRATAAAVHRIAAEFTRSGVPRRLRILEVGAGTGATTASLLPVLAGFDVEYLFTDVSALFLTQAAATFAAYPWVSYGLFDIDADHRAQGLFPNSFDVIVCAGVLNASRDIDQALARLRELAVPGGWLVITEPTGAHHEILISQAFMMAEATDARAGSASAFLTLPQWERALESAGARLGLRLPGDGHPLEPLGQHLFAAQVKTDRAAVTAAELTARLRERLPEWMIPAQLQVVDALPRTANGKIDRTLLARQAVAVSSSPQAAGDPPREGQESELAALWAQIAGVSRVGRSQSFFELGADSLVLAKYAGELRSRIPAAAEASFDALLRQLLAQPTIAELATYLNRRPALVATEQRDARDDKSNAVLVGFDATPAGEGRLRVLLHEGLGTMGPYRPLAAELVAQRQGRVVGLAIDEAERYLRLESSELFERLADRYVERLAGTGHDRIQLIGYCIGGMLAVELARRLGERGVEVEQVALVSSHPLTFKVEDELMVEGVFALTLGINPAVVGFDWIDPGVIERAYATVFRSTPGRLPSGALAALGGDPELDRLAAMMREAGRRPQPERLRSYGEALAATGARAPAELVPQLYQVFRHSFHGSHYTPEPYAGDVTFLLPAEGSGFVPGLEETTLAFWREVVLGRVRVVDVPGNHYSCMREPNVAEVAAALAPDGRPA